MSAVWDAPAIMRERIVDAHIDLTGKALYLVVFEGCVLECWRRPGTVTWAHSCQFLDCDLVGDGWPQEAMDVCGRR